MNLDRIHGPGSKFIPAIDDYAATKRKEYAKTRATRVRAMALPDELISGWNKH